MADGYFVGGAEPSDRVLKDALDAEMVRVRDRLARLMGRDPALRPTPGPAVLRLPVSPRRDWDRNRITVVPGWGERPRFG